MLTQNALAHLDSKETFPPQCTQAQAENNPEKIEETHHQTIDPENQEKQKQNIFHFMEEFKQLYKYGQPREKVLMVVGIIIGLASGLPFPLFVYVWGRQQDNINFNFNNLASSMDTSRDHFIMFIAIGIFAILIDGLLFAIWRILSESITYKFRTKYLTAFTKKSTAKLEKENLYELSLKFKTNCFAIERAIGDKVALFYNLQGILICGSIAALCVRWTYTLYLFALLPIAMAILGSFLYVLIKKKNAGKQFYEKADTHAVEATSLIKTVKMMGGQDHEGKIYNLRLEDFKEKIKPFSLKLGITTGLFYFIQYLMYGLGYIIAIQCARGTAACPVSLTGSHYSMGDILIVFYQMFLCTYNFLQIASNFEAIKSGITASKEIFKFVEDEQPINASKQDSHITQIGNIELKNVEFSYPSDPEKIVLRNISLRLQKNKFNAFVGFTGSGKSTIVQLLLKFYEPTQGSILINGLNILQLNTSRLRDRIGYVSQQPVLFNSSIRENVKVGKPDATDQQVIAVLKKTHIYDFVMTLPGNLDFVIGYGGSKLSGGQKQRLAIARALVKNPQLLILDEATSALDRKTERLIQETVESIFQSNQNKMTVLCIAHRLKTIQHADKIWHFEKGQIKEEGRFNEMSYFKDAEIELDKQKVVEMVETKVNNLQKNISTEEKKQHIQEVKESKVSGVYKRLLSFTQYRGRYFIGIFASIISGLNHPAAAVMLAFIQNQIISLYNQGERVGWCQNAISPGECEDKLDVYYYNTLRILYVMIGFAFFAFIPYLVQVTLLSKVQDDITHNVRKATFKKLMEIPVQWHEKAENEGGRAASRCGVDTRQVSGILTNYVPVMVSNVFTIATAIIITLIYRWDIGLISLFATPMIAIAAYISMKFISGYEDQTLKMYEESNKVADQLILNIKTIQALNYQQAILKKYETVLFQPKWQAAKRGFKIGMFLGSSIMIMQLGTAVLLYVSVHILLNDPHIYSIDFVVVFTLPVWCGWIAGNNFFFTSQSNAGEHSARNIFQILDHKSEASIQGSEVVKQIIKPASEIKGKIEFKNVSFRYRKDNKEITNIRNVSFVIEAGQKAAFVGPSGCGKSTLLQLLMRFYRYDGEILLDGINILEYDLKTYRQYFSMVNQEPSLFLGSLKDNVVYNRQASQKEIIEVCEIACAFDINKYGDVSQKISEFLAKEVGPKGSKISGGEKQRVACARALLRKPSIFIMDEGTSALDNKTEKEVQRNIDEHLQGKTAINVAHRIETIENSDIIFLFEGGSLQEKGNYNQLMANKGQFYSFVKGKNMQN